MDLPDILTTLFVVLLSLHSVTVSLMRYEEAKAANCGAHKLWWSLLGACKHLSVDMRYIGLRFAIAQWLAVLKIIEAFPCVAWMLYASMAHNLMEYEVAEGTSCKPQDMWRFTMIMWEYFFIFGYFSRRFLLCNRRACWKNLGRVIH